MGRRGHDLPRFNCILYKIVVIRRSHDVEFLLAKSAMMCHGSDECDCQAEKEAQAWLFRVLALS